MVPVRPNSRSSGDWITTLDHFTESHQVPPPQTNPTHSTQPNQPTNYKPHAVNAAAPRGRRC
jgi:hypothetical protein